MGGLLTKAMGVNPFTEKISEIWFYFYFLYYRKIKMPFCLFICGLSADKLILGCERILDYFLIWELLPCLQAPRLYCSLSPVFQTEYILAFSLFSMVVSPVNILVTSEKQPQESLSNLQIPVCFIVIPASFIFSIFQNHF